MESRVSHRSKGRRVAGGLCIALSALGVLAIVMLFASNVAAAPPTIPGATYVGSDTCKGCHEEVFKATQHTLHGKLLGTPLSKGDLQARGCEACHGPGSKHVEDQANPANNLRFGKKSPLKAADQNAICLQCHARGKQMLWAGSPHESRDVTCVTCHTAHGKASHKGQLKLIKPERYDTRGESLDAVQYDLCGTCHMVRAMQFGRYSHMPLAANGEGGKITCSSCHNPHGTVSAKLIPAVSITESCTACHADKRGPFLYQHPPVIENCLNCHQAHGSNTQYLLRMRLPRLCQTCHTGTQHPGQTYAQTDRKVFSQSCANCHTQIHGSNHPSGFYFTR